MTDQPSFAVRMAWKLDIIEWSLPAVFTEDDARVFHRLVCKNYDPDAVFIKIGGEEVLEP